MANSQQFEVFRSDIHRHRTGNLAIPKTLDPGQILVRIERFALTANNITYGIVGEKFGYWNFFPTADGQQDWGVIPVWGMGIVEHSEHEQVPIGERLYGYFPMGERLVMQADRVKPHRLIDASAHRSELAPVYNSYARVGAEPGYDPKMDDERILLFPLYATSFCLYDFLEDNAWFDAGPEKGGQVIIISASSKTALGLAMALREADPSPTIVGLTSPGNKQAVEQSGLYDEVHLYDSLTTINADKPSVIVDMSGNGKVLGSLHRHLNDNMRYCSNVGATHYEDNQMGPDFIKERSAMFFAPGHIQKRTKQWGPGEFEARALAFWNRAAIASRSWLNIDLHQGFDEIEDVYAHVLNAKVPASSGKVVVL